MFKVGPHSLYELGDTHRWLELVPTVAKFCYGLGPVQYALPGTLCVGRPDADYFLEQYPVLSRPPEELARQYVGEVFAPLIPMFPRIDVWEGPNEVVIAPDDVERMRWYAAFLAEFADGIHGLGKVAGCGSWAVGTPEFDLWKHYVPVLQACREGKAVLTRHSYGPLDEWYALRHRKDEAAFRALGYENSPVIISECGADNLSIPGWGPWKKLWPTLADYWREWIEPFAQELNKDSYVLGATLFTVGDGYAVAWQNFDVSGLGLPELIAAEWRENAEEKETMPIYWISLVGETGEQVTVPPESVSEVARFQWAAQRYLAEHNTLNGFAWPRNPGWVGNLVVGDEKKDKVRATPQCRLYHSPSDPKPYLTINDLREMRVYEIRTGWLCVWKDAKGNGTRDIWVHAEDCVPL